MTEPAGQALELRPAAESDFETVFAITMATMRAYVEATWGIWDEAEHRSRIRDSFEPSTHRLVHVDGQLAGLLAVKVHAEHVQLVKLFLLASFQGRGIGTRLVRQVMAQAAAQERRCAFECCGSIPHNACTCGWASSSPTRHPSASSWSGDRAASRAPTESPRGRWPRAGSLHAEVAARLVIDRHDEVQGHGADD